MPAAWRCIASRDWRITPGRTFSAHRSRTFLICRRSKKEYPSAVVTSPARSHPANCRGVIRRIRSRSVRLYRYTAVIGFPSVLSATSQELSKPKLLWKSEQITGKQKIRLLQRETNRLVFLAQNEQRALSIGR